MTNHVNSLQPAPTTAGDVVEMRLCEASRVGLRPDTTYRFTVDPNCHGCVEAASPYTASPSPEAAIVAARLDECLPTVETMCGKNAGYALRDAAALLRRLAPKAGVGEDEREAFKAAHPHFDLAETQDAWGRTTFAHSHIEAIWDGWKERAALSAPKAGAQADFKSWFAQTFPHTEMDANDGDKAACAARGIARTAWCAALTPRDLAGKGDGRG